MNAATSPLPWTKNGAAVHWNNSIPGYWSAGTICDAPGNTETDHANMAFIVKSANCHASLMAACEYALRIFEAWKLDAAPHPSYETNDNSEWAAANNAANTMREVIAKAK